MRLVMKQSMILMCAWACWLGILSPAMAAGDAGDGASPCGVGDALHLGIFAAGFQYGSHTLEGYGVAADYTTSGVAVGSSGALQLGYVLDMGLELGVTADVAYARASMRGFESWGFDSSGLALVQYYFLPRDICSPYLTLGLGGFYSDSPDTSLYGFRAKIMAGLVYLVGSAAALDARGMFSYDIGEARTTTGSFDARGWTVGLQLGVSLYL